MKLTLAEPRYLKDSISIISELVNEARFKITPNAIELAAMDPANVAMVIFKLLSSCFVEYDVKDVTEIAVNLNNLKQVLKRAKANDMLTLEVDQDNKLLITFKGKSVRTFSLPILDLDESEQRVPDLKFPLVVKTSAGVIADAIEDVDVVAESVTFAGEPDKLTIYAEGDLSKARIDIKADDETKIKSETTEKVKAKYSIEYLKKMITGARISDDVRLSFNNDYPMKLEFAALDRVLLSFILAPRVEND
ncbi:proliferating cell nuclear antigen (pcna) [Candidatus Woesearchaeota archaeon]|nr:MAG: proliferating cell nuclear antigen (pcna) [Candidatus Woesearchaeota archaeon]